MKGQDQAHRVGFDAHPYRTEFDPWDFVDRNLRTYKIMKDKVKQFNKDKKIQKILKDLHNSDPAMEGIMRRFTSEGAKKLQGHSFDPMAISRKKLPYEELDQRVQELLLGVL